MIRSGIAPLDIHLGGVLPGRLHLVAGGVGTGKTSACLHFLAAGLQAGETAVLLTHDRGDELYAHAAWLGLDVRTPLRARRLTILRFRPQFAQQLAHAPSADWMIEDLKRMLGRLIEPCRIAIDPITPFLGDGSPAGAGVRALAELLDELGATALLTWPGSLIDGADRRLDPLIERAATIAVCERNGVDGYQLRIARARLVEAPRAPIPFTFVKGVGLADDDNGAAAKEALPAVIQIASGP